MKRKKRLEYRVRATQAIGSFDGGTSVVVLPGTEGTAVFVNTPGKPLNGYPEKPTTAHVYWDVVLLNHQNDTESGVSVYQEHFEDPRAPLSALVFVELRSQS